MFAGDDACASVNASKNRNVREDQSDAFTEALAAVPAEDWSRTWAADRTIMLRMTSKRVKELVDKLYTPAVVCWRRSFFEDERNGTVQKLYLARKYRAAEKLNLLLKLLAAEKLQLILRQLAALSARCRITTLELEFDDLDLDLCDEYDPANPCSIWWLDDKEGLTLPEGQDPERLEGVLARCRSLVHLNLNGNRLGDAGAERLAGVLGQCAALAHLNPCCLSVKQITKSKQCKLLLNMP
jgi:hypothetical protein